MSVKYDGFSFEKLFDPLSNNINWCDWFEESQYLSLSILLGIFTAGIGHGLYQGITALARFIKRIKKIEKSSQSIKTTLDENKKIQITKKIPIIEGSNERNTYMLKNRFENLKYAPIGIQFSGKISNIDPVAVLKEQDGRLFFEVQNTIEIPEIEVNGRAITQYDDPILLDEKIANKVYFTGKQILFFGQEPDIKVTRPSRP